jgi:hypothetical protein
MPVDAATLDRYISEVAGDDEELAGILREKLGTKEQAASRFVGGYLRNADYTQKTQELARYRDQYAQQQQEYENRLSQAEQEKDQIMRDLAEERITAARASSLLKTVKQAYSLSDTDIPGIDDLRETARTGTVVDSTPDLDKRLEAFEKQIMSKLAKQLIPEISGLAMLGPVWNEIEREHHALFGKHITKKEEADILKQARDENRSLEQVWTEKFAVPDKRLEMRDQTNRDKWRREWDDEQSKKNQEAALRGVSPDSREYGLEDRQSPLFKRSFVPKEEGKSEPPPGRAPIPAHNDAAKERMGAADRAAAKFMERARNGQLGKPIEATRA